jgi:hypothetical protein
MPADTVFSPISPKGSSFAGSSLQLEAAESLPEVGKDFKLRVIDNDYVEKNLFLRSGSL